ncbi:MAG: IS4 family transposase, partial [Luteimonas sp.]
MGWAADEWATADLGDVRLNRRLVKVAQQLADKPTASIPGACGGWADTLGTYRMLSNDRVDWRDVLEPHIQRTVQRMAEESLVLCLQDTTELDFNGQAIDGLGPLSYEAQRGMYLHPTYAVSPQREPLGVLDAWMWAREPRDAQGQRGGVTESVRWIEGYERLAEVSQELPGTRLMQVGDRESDMFELMRRAQDMDWPVDLLVRSQHNRVLPEGQRLWDQVQACASVGEIEFTMGGRPGRTARMVKQALRVKRVHRGGKGEAGVAMTCVIASEIAAPQGDGLDFVPMVTERYFFICQHAALQAERVAALVELLRDATFQQQL